MGSPALSTTDRSVTSRWWPWAAVAFIFVATFVVYLPAMRGEFIWDDDSHVTQAELRSWHGLYRIWFELDATQQYYPLLHSAFWVQHRLWGDSPTGYHVVNVLMHAGVATLLMLVLRRLGFSMPAAFLAAGIFALHPVHVESVAWITELKNTLSGVFYLSAMLVYLRFDGSRKPSHYFAALGLFILGLLTKTVIATLPAALLVIFWWNPRKREQGGLQWKRDVRPVLPWFVLGAAAGLFTAWVEYTYIGAQGDKFAFPMVERFLVAGRVVWFYLGKLLWPVNLAFNYPRWKIDPGAAWQWLYPAALLGLLIVLVILARRWRGPLAAMLLFVGTLFPVLGFLNVYPFVFSFVADHFQYLASMSVIALVVGLAAAGAARAPASVRLVLRGCLFVPLIVLGVLTFRQSATYADAVTLYRTTVERNPESWLVHNTLGTALWRRGDMEAAMRHYERSLELHPGNANAHYTLGLALRKLGRLEESRSHFAEALRYRPRFVDVHYNLGLTLIDLGRPQEAATHFLDAVRLKPDHVEAMNNLGVLCSQSGRFEEAIKWFNRSLAIAPNRPHVLMNLALAYDASGQSAQARAAAAKALEAARSTGQVGAAAKIQAWIDEHR